MAILSILVGGILSRRFHGTKQCSSQFADGKNGEWGTECS
ncbi:MAG: hypothetical protein OJF47_000634 [Nitrospira sp.]|nr:MAG: hypothetical protein OJF47_000634 [Nitrospira sp.]